MNILTGVGYQLAPPVNISDMACHLVRLALQKYPADDFA